jgi:hypothetical protein
MNKLLVKLTLIGCLLLGVAMQHTIFANQVLTLQGNGYASCGTANFSLKPLTVELWAFKSDWNIQGHEVIAANSASGGWLFRIKDGSLQATAFLNGTESVLSFPVSVLKPGWHHLALTFDGNYLRFFVDGSQRQYLYKYKSTLTAPLTNTWLVIGASSGVGGVGGNNFSGSVDEFRIWNRALSATEIKDWMHRPLSIASKPLYIDKLLVYYPFDSASFIQDMSVTLNTSAAFNLQYTQQVSQLQQSVPLYNMPDELKNCRGYWSAFENGTFSEGSGGFYVGVQNYNEFDNGESILLAHNGLTGVTTDNLPEGIDVLSLRQWMLVATYDDELPVVRVHVDEASIRGLLYNCIAVSNYKLLYRAQPTDTFKIIAEGVRTDGPLFYFSETNYHNGYYAIARVNDMPMVNSLMEVTDVTATSALFGGVVGCDGGSEVTARGVCWNSTGSATIADSLTVNGAGMGEFTSNLTPLVPGVTYYARAYATNSKGTAYGEEIAFQTTKLFQTISFPALPQKTWGDADFNPGASASSGLPVSYSSSNAGVATIVNNKIHITGVGSTTIWASQSGSQSYSAASAKKATLVVGKASLTVIATDTFKTYGDENPSFAVAFKGFVNGQSAADIDILPNVTTIAETYAYAGMYDLTPQGGSDNHYQFSYQSGWFAVFKKDPELISTPELTPILLGDFLSNSEILGGEANLPGSFRFVNPQYVPSSNGEEVCVCFVPDDSVNYNTLQTKSTILVDILTAIRGVEPKQIEVFPNPTTEYIYIKGLTVNTVSATMRSLNGQVVMHCPVVENRIDLSYIEPGIYLLTIEGKTIRVVKGR